LSPSPLEEIEEIWVESVSSRGDRGDRGDSGTPDNETDSTHERGLAADDISRGGGETSTIDELTIEKCDGRTKVFCPLAGSKCGCSSKSCR
jgi:hypothetical protein